MKISEARVLLTGATGGIGAASARLLLERGASVLLTARSENALERLRTQLGNDERVAICAADLTRREDREKLCRYAAHWRGGINVLINNAGVSTLQWFEDTPASEFECMIATNLLAPMHLCRELLPHLQRQPTAHILNVGSVMGSLGFPGYSAYCASKFGLRGFSEALRRELAHSRIVVQHLAPRATQTAINGPAVVAMNEALGTRMDPPARVAAAILRMLESTRSNVVIGWPEKLFARINQLLPGIVDRALRTQLPIIRTHACASVAATELTSNHLTTERTSA